MLKPEPIKRDKEGFWVHSAVLAADEETAWDDLPGADGMQFTYRAFERDAPPELVTLYDQGEGDKWTEAVRQWNPTPPDGDGWFLVGIYDTEDGPHAAFARPTDS